MVQQKAPGFGVQAHRIIKAICELVGIKDIRVKIGKMIIIKTLSRNFSNSFFFHVSEGAISPLNITRAFFLGLLRQRTHQLLANEKGLHLVEFRPENYNFPLVIYFREIECIFQNRLTH